MNIEDLTLKQIREINSLTKQEGNGCSLNKMVGQKVIIRTFSAGNWFGLLAEKSGSEVILKNARRMYRWQCAQSISLSALSIYGIDERKSKIVEEVESVWLKAIEIIPCTAMAIKSLEEAENVKAE